ncbi:MAG TPA: hypothetical protein VF276_07540 [Chloroflexia bacterium]
MRQPQARAGRHRRLPATGDWRGPPATTATNARHTGNDGLRCGRMRGVPACGLLAQTTLNVAPTMAPDRGVARIVGAAILLLPTYVRRGTYKIPAIGAFAHFGSGRAFYAPPSTDAAIANLPDAPAGSASGSYKMAASRGGSCGGAVSAVIVPARSGDHAPGDGIAGGITCAGWPDHRMISAAARFAVGANLLPIGAAISAILLTVPKGRLHEETRT